MEYLKEDEQTFSVLLEGEFQSAGTLRDCAKMLLSRLVEARKRVEELERENRWIPVSDPPRIGEWVNVVCNGVVQRMAAHLDMAIGVPKRWYWADRDADPAPLDAVTHWRPLPSPPQAVSPDCKVHGMDKEGKNEP